MQFPAEHRPKSKKLEGEGNRCKCVPGGVKSRCKADGSECSRAERKCSGYPAV